MLTDDFSIILMDNIKYLQLNEEITLKHKRLYYLDTLRAFLMISGLFVHVNSIHNVDLYLFITKISAVFRMEAFYIIAGFFIALLNERKFTYLLIIDRFKAYTLPFIFCVLVLNPVTLYLIYFFHEKNYYGQVYFDAFNLFSQKALMPWHLHAWFLIPLIFYSFLIPFILYLSKKLSYIIGISMGGKVNKSIFTVLIITIFWISLKFTSKLITSAIEIDFESKSFLINSIFTNFIYVVLGGAFFYNKALLEHFSTINFKLLFIFIPFLIFYIFLPDAIEFDKVIFTILEPFVALLLSSILFSVFYKFFNKNSKFIKIFSDASYTIYILHYFFIYFISSTLITIQPEIDIDIYFVNLVLTITFILCMASHYLITKNKFSSLIINGKYQ